MVKKKIKLVALDMDGTLLNDDDEVSKENFEAIQKALAEEVHVVLATGRTITTTYPFSEQLQLPSYLVTVNGGQIWTVEKELLHSHYLDAQFIKMMWEFSQEISGLRTWMVTPEKTFFNERPEDFTRHNWLKFGCHTLDQTALNRMIKKLSNYDDKLEITNSLPTNLEVNPIGVNKANALKQVCEKLNITMDNVLAAGDSLNDIKMIKEAGIGVAMGNAQEAVKEVADVIVETNVGHGVARAIERYVLKGSDISSNA